MPPLPFLLILLLGAAPALAAPPAVAAIQVCGDNSTFRPCPNVTSPVIYISELLHNPYHAFYQVVWPFTHFLTRFFEQTGHDPKKTTVVLPGEAVGYAGCLDRPRKGMPEDPFWQNCVTHLVLRQFGVPPDRVFRTANTRPPTSSDVIFFSRPIFQEGLKRIQNAYDGPTGRNYTFGVEKMDRLAALRFIRKAVVEGVWGASRQARPPKNFMHVVVYDRTDANWRKWSNSREVLPYLDHDPRVHVTHIREFPTVFSAQVRLAQDADVLVGPHGAAFANTVFMKEGSSVVEIWRCCGQKVKGQEATPRAWTGWHAQHIGVQLRYVQCLDNVTNLKTAPEFLNGTWCPNEDPAARLHYFIVEPQVLAQEVLSRVDDFFRARNVSDAMNLPKVEAPVQENDSVIFHAAQSGIRSVERHLESQLSLAVVICAVATSLMSGFMIGRMSLKRKCGY